MNEMSILALAKICGEAGRDHATVEMIRKCLDNDVPNEYIKLLLANNDMEELKTYRSTGLTPEKIREFDREYQRKCSLVKSLVDVSNKLRDRVSNHMSGDVKAQKTDLQTILSLMNIKEFDQVKKIISDAIEKGMNIGCIGTVGTGKATLLKQILIDNGIAPNNEDQMYQDGLYQSPVNKNERQKVSSGEWKYFLADVHNVKEFIYKFLDYSNSQVNNFLLITCKKTDNKDRVLSSIDEVQRKPDGNYDIVNVYSNPIMKKPNVENSERTLQSVINFAKGTSELFTNEGHEYIDNLMKWLIIGRRNVIFSGCQNVGKSSAMHAYMKEIPESLPIHYFPPNDYDLRFFTNRKNAVIVIEEIVSDLSALQYVQATNKLTSVLTTHHAPTVEQLITSFRNHLLSTNVFQDEKSAERTAVKVINIDFHMEMNHAGERFVERITEIIPADDLTDGKLYTTRNLIEYRDGKYVMVAMSSDKMLDEIRMMLSDSDKEAFEKDMKILRNAISVAEEDTENTTEADNAVTENAEETTAEDKPVDVEAEEETAEDNKSKGGKKRKLDI